MKKLSTIVAIVAMLFVSSYSKADVYTDGIKAMINSGNISMLNTSQFQQMSQMTGKQFNETEFVNNIAETLASYYRENMTEAEFSKMVAFYNSEKIKTVSTKMTSNIGGMMEGAQQSIMPAMMTLMQGGTPDPIPMDNASEEFKQAFEHFYTVNNAEGISSQIVAVAGIMTEQMSDNIPEDFREQALSGMKSMLTYMKANMKTIMFNSLSKSTTVDDLNTMSSIEKESFYPSMMKTTNAIYADLPKILKNIAIK